MDEMPRIAGEGMRWERWARWALADMKPAEYNPRNP